MFKWFTKIYERFFPKPKKEVTYRTTTYAHLIAEEALRKCIRTSRENGGFSISRLQSLAPNVRRAVLLEVAEQKGFVLKDGYFWRL